MVILIFIFFIFLITFILIVRQKEISKSTKKVDLSIWGFFLLVYLAIFIPASYTNYNNNEQFIHEYYALRQSVEYARVNDLSPLERIKIIDTIHETNKTISQHRVRYNSIYVGLWYSKEIANLEFLK